MSAVLTDPERHDLALLAAAMLPADPALGLPGADDPAILADIERSIGRDLDAVRATLAAVMAKNFTRLDVDRREALLNDFFGTGDIAAGRFARLVLGAYYRDDRVLVAVGQEARPPFPKGYVLEQGDWSLLDTVRARPVFWRDDRSGKGR